MNSLDSSMLADLKRHLVLDVVFLIILSIFFYLVAVLTIFSVAFVLYMLFVIVIIIDIVSSLYECTHKSKKRRIFESIASKRGGTVQGIHFPVIIIPYKGCRIVVRGEKRESVGGGSGWMSSFRINSHGYKGGRTVLLTEVDVKLSQNIGHNLVIKKKTLRHEILTKLSKEYVKTNNKLFDDYYVVKGESDFVLGLLNNKVISQLLTKHEEYPVNIYLEEDSLYLYTKYYVEEEDFFESLIDKATTIIDRLIELEYL